MGRFGPCGPEPAIGDPVSAGSSRERLIREGQVHHQQAEIRPGLERFQTRVPAHHDAVPVPRRDGLSEEVHGTLGLRLGLDRGQAGGQPGVPQARP